MAIESGITLAVLFRNWKTSNLRNALQFYQDIRKPRTDRITRTSYEAGKLASSDVLDKVTLMFNPEALRDRMKWIMEEALITLSSVQKKGKDQQKSCSCGCSGLLAICFCTSVPLSSQRLYLSA